MGRIILCVAIILALGPSLGDAGCGDGNCAVGGIGIGGDASGGKAQGSHFEEQIPEGTLSNNGNASAGRLEIGSLGSINGTFRSDTARGHGTGIFGEWSGHCEDPFGDPDAC